MRALLRRLRARIKYRHFERDLAQELEQHRALAEAELTAAGRSARDARWQAAKQLGNTTLAREESRGIWIWRWADEVRQDLNYGIRTLLRQPTFALTAIATLTLGLGLTGSLITVFNAAFLKPWPVGDPDQVVAVSSSLTADLSRVGKISGAIRDGAGIPGGAAREIMSSARQADFTFISSLGAGFRVPFEVTPGLPFVKAAFVSDNFMEVLRLPVRYGTGFSTKSSSDNPTVVITDELWQRVFGADPDIAGTTTTLNGVTVTINGVLPRHFIGLAPREFAVLVPASAAGAWPDLLAAAPLLATGTNACCVDIIGRRRPTSSQAALTAELTGLVQRFAREQGAAVASVQLTDTSMAGRRGVDPQSAQLYALLTTGCGLVWLLACVNVGNLELARGFRRTRELRTRLALGAGRSRIVRQLVTEALLLATVAATLACGVAYLAPPVLMQKLGATPAVRYTPDAAVALMIAALAFAAALIFGLVPAVQCTRMGLAAEQARRSRWLRGTVLAAQLALSAVLLVSATLLWRSVSEALAGHMDFGVNDVAIVQITPPSGAPDLSDHLQLRAAWARLTAAMAADRTPFAQIYQAPIGSRRTPITASSDTGTQHDAVVFPMSSAGMSLLGVRLTRGRLYADALATHEAVVNASLAEALWPKQDPLGRQIRLGSYDSAPFTVVGVAESAHLTSLGDLKPLVHVPLPKSVPIVLTALMPRAADADAALRRVVARVDSRMAVSIRPLADDVRKALEDQIIGARIAAGLAGIALLLSIVGVFGVFAFVVEERRRDVGVRLALGAGRDDVVRAVFATAWVPLVSGIVAGLLLSLAATSTLRAYLLGVNVGDPQTYGIVTTVLGVSIGIATFIPLRRAMRVDPAITLRAE